MNAKELMIGDLVSLRNKSYKIGALSSHCVVLQGYEPIGLDWNDIEPIPLTAEILKANGFRESSIESGCYYFPERYQELNDRGFAVEEDEGRFWITDHQLMMTRYSHKFQHALRLCGLTDLADDFKV